MQTGAAQPVSLDHRGTQSQLRPAQSRSVSSAAAPQDNEIEVLGNVDHVFLPVVVLVLGQRIAAVGRNPPRRSGRAAACPGTDDPHEPVSVLSVLWQWGVVAPTPRKAYRRRFRVYSPSGSVPEMLLHPGRA
ncbi:hypothetical protein GCM10018780_91470 [Streptomyces lanatus]|nr:hypothetical protein GCM10018780_91470 [Streptomyces lanatus]